MKHSYLKNNLSLLLAAVLTAGVLSACVSPKVTPDSTAKDNSTTESSTDSREMVGNMYTTGYPLVKTQESFRILMNNGTDPAQMKLWQDYETKTNVKVVWDFYDYDTCVEKKNLMYTSMDYPDAIGTWCLEDKDIITYANSVFIPVEESIAKYAPNVTNALDNFPNGRAILTAPDNHIYGFGIMAPQADCAWIMHINRSWLEKLNLTVPTTTDEFEAVLKAFKEKDPNGNGNMKDEIPLSFFGENYQNLFGAFGRVDNPEHLVLESGKVVFTADKDEYMAGIKWLRKLYEQGLIDPEAFTQDSTQFGTKGKSGDLSVYGVFVDFTGVNGVNQDRYEAEYQSLAPVAGPAGDRIWGQGDRWIFRDQMAITTAAKNPDTIVRWIDGLFDPEMSYQVCYGQIGEWTEKTAEGKYQYKPFPEGTNESDIRNNYTVSAMPYCIMPEFYANIVPNPGTMIKTKADATVLPYLTKEPYPVIWKTNEQNEALATISGDLKKLVDDKCVQWITGQSNIDNEWTQYLTDLKSIGVEKYVEVNQQAVDTYLKNAK